MTVLYFGAKAPVPGQVKTRLAATVGPRAAANLYAAFLADLQARFRGAPFPVAWYVTPAAWPGLRSRRVRIQAGQGWSERQAHLFRVATAAGHSPVVLAATDSPQLEPERVTEAFAALAVHDLVFGPTFDGGYYLVGMRAFHDVFTGVAMSTESALAQALERARARRLSVALLAPEFDVDTAADLAFLAHRRDLAATAAALRALEVAA